MSHLVGLATITFLGEMAFLLIFDDFSKKPNNFHIYRWELLEIP